MFGFLVSHLLLLLLPYSLYGLSWDFFGFMAVGASNFLSVEGNLDFGGLLAKETPPRLWFLFLGHL